jgi:hypothetical protein
MKKIVVGVVLSLVLMEGRSQGLVNFFNIGSTLVSAGPSGGPSVGPSPGAYYFALLTAPAGSSSPLQFTFTGLYATNISVAGRFFGGTGVAVPGWQPGTSRSFMVAGWSSNFGHDWNQDWLAGDFPDQGVFGLSSVGTGIAGGATSVGPIPPLNLFGGAVGIQVGWNLVPVGPPIPEPTTTTLGILGIIAFMFRREKGKSRARILSTVPNKSSQATPVFALPFVLSQTPGAPEFLRSTAPL